MITDLLSALAALCQTHKQFDLLLQRAFHYSIMNVATQSIVTILLNRFVRFA